ncbi:hypothetical protein [Mycobacterium paragordonae]|uniref:hypothetical protein n=1 Tax=Mycobacterium paragordonae TaxID=1389713 RepID=UPI003530A879
MTLPNISTAEVRIPGFTVDPVGLGALTLPNISTAEVRIPGSRWIRSGWVR